MRGENLSALFIAIRQHLPRPGTNLNTSVQEWYLEGVLEQRNTVDRTSPSSHGHNAKTDICWHPDVWPTCYQVAKVLNLCICLGVTNTNAACRASKTMICKTAVYLPHASHFRLGISAGISEMCSDCFYWPHCFGSHFTVPFSFFEGHGGRPICQCVPPAPSGTSVQNKAGKTVLLTWPHSCAHPPDTILPLYRSPSLNQRSFQ